jgi:hypothetical protein
MFDFSKHFVCNVYMIIFCGQLLIHVLSKEGSTQTNFIPQNMNAPSQIKYTKK